MAVVLNLAFVVSVFADPGGDPNDNASDKAQGSVWRQEQKYYNTEIYEPGDMCDFMSNIAQDGDKPWAGYDVHELKGQPMPPGPIYPH